MAMRVPIDDQALCREIRIYAAQEEVSVKQVVDRALRNLLAASARQTARRQLTALPPTASARPAGAATVPAGAVAVGTLPPTG